MGVGDNLWLVLGPESKLQPAQVLARLQAPHLSHPLAWLGRRECSVQGLASWQPGGMPLGELGRPLGRAE